jgi:hypothetical protein
MSSLKSIPELLLQTLQKSLISSLIQLLIFYNREYRRSLSVSIVQRGRLWGRFHPPPLSPKPSAFASISNYLFGAPPAPKAHVFYEYPPDILPCVIAHFSCFKSLTLYPRLPALLKEIFATKDVSKVPAQWNVVVGPERRFTLTYCDFVNGMIEFGCSKGGFEFEGTCDASGICRYRWSVRGLSTTVKATVDNIARLDEYGVYGFVSAGMRGRKKRGGRRERTDKRAEKGRTRERRKRKTTRETTQIFVYQVRNTLFAVS